MREAKLRDVDELLGLGEGLVGGVGADEVDVVAVEGAPPEAHGDEPERARPLVAGQGEVDDITDDRPGLLGGLGLAGGRGPVASGTDDTTVVVVGARGEQGRQGEAGHSERDAAGAGEPEELAAPHRRAPTGVER